MQHFQEVTNALQEINGNLRGFADRLDSIYRQVAGPLPPMPTDPTAKSPKEPDCHLDRWGETISCIARTERYIADMLGNIEQRVMDSPVSSGLGTQARNY